MPLTLGDLMNPPSTLPGRVNLCPGSSKFIDLVNRATMMLLEHGSWWGTEQPAFFRVYDSCITMPAVVASINGLRGCNGKIPIETEWYRLSTPTSWDDCFWDSSLRFEFFDLVCTFYQGSSNGKIRVYPKSTEDVGKKIVFQGYDSAGNLVRTRQDGLYKDGEQLVIASPFVESATTFRGAPTGVVKQETADALLIYQVVSGVLSQIAKYEYWETTPQYQRFRINNFCDLSRQQCCPGMVEARCKLQFIPAKYADDIILIGNRQAMEFAVQAVKAYDDRHYGEGDVLMFGDPKNKRTGAIPLLNQELRTHTGDRTTTRVVTRDQITINRKMVGFI